ncbi:MAG: hypothetical protein K0V04_14245 [Deltaproteobacteria bacterium]|nr:hypothetical protein [Deltaproteobacteria bacterium]
MTFTHSNVVRSLSKALLAMLLVPGCDLVLVESGLDDATFNGQSYVLESAFAATDFRVDGDIDWYAIYDAEHNEVQCRCATTHVLHGTYSLTDWSFTGMTLADTVWDEFVWLGQEDKTAADRAPRVVKLDWECNMIGYGPIATPAVGGHSTHIMDMTSDEDGNPWILVKRVWPAYPSYDMHAIYTAHPTSGGYHFIWPEHDLDGDIPPEHHDQNDSMRIVHDDFDDTLAVFVDDEAPEVGWMGIYTRGGWHNTNVGNELTLSEERLLTTDGLGLIRDVARWHDFVVMATSEGVVTFEDDDPSDAYYMSVSSVALVPEQDANGGWLLPSIYAEGNRFDGVDGRVHRFALQP